MIWAIDPRRPGWEGAPAFNPLHLGIRRAPLGRYLGETFTVDDFMSTRQKPDPMGSQPQPKSKGAVAAERIRAKTNQLTDEQREVLLQRARALMGESGVAPKPCARSR